MRRAPNIKSFNRASFYTLFGINLMGRTEVDSTNLKDGTTQMKTFGKHLFNQLR